MKIIQAMALYLRTRRPAAAPPTLRLPSSSSSSSSQPRSSTTIPKAPRRAVAPLKRQLAMLPHSRPRPCSLRVRAPTSLARCLNLGASERVKSWRCKITRSGGSEGEHSVRCEQIDRVYIVAFLNGEVSYIKKTKTETEISDITSKSSGISARFPMVGYMVLPVHCS